MRSNETSISESTLPQAPDGPGPLANATADSTGGWRWHCRAMFAGARWSCARRGIDTWLESVPRPIPPRLLWVGASAGWMLPTRFLKQFVEIDVIDIDHSARLILALRHGRALRRAGIPWRWHCIDAIAHIDELLGRWPEALILFDNLLGQQRYRYSDGDRLERWLSALPERLSGRTWGSVHDWLSGPTNGLQSSRTDGGFETLCFERTAAGVALAPSMATVRAPGTPHARPGRAGSAAGTASVVRSGAALTDWLLEQVGGGGVWQDHLTGAVFPIGTQGFLIPWRFSRTHFHWLQAGWVDRQTASGVSAHRVAVDRIGALAPGAPERARPTGPASR
jgi:hypothetical protein